MNTMKRGRSLTTETTWIAVMVTGSAMLVYAVLQYITMPGMSFLHILAEHTWHVVALGVLTYVALHFSLHKKVVEPVHALHLAFYRIARGETKPIMVQTNILEIQDIVEGVNLMLSQLQLTSHEPWVGKLRSGAEALRALSGKTPPTLGVADQETLAGLATQMEELAVVFERFEAKAQNLRHELL